MELVCRVPFAFGDVACFEGGEYCGEVARGRRRGVDARSAVPLKSRYGW